MGILSFVNTYDINKGLVLPRMRRLFLFFFSLQLYRKKMTTM